MLDNRGMVFPERASATAGMAAIVAAMTSVVMTSFATPLARHELCPDCLMRRILLGFRWSCPDNPRVVFHVPCDRP
jgi:hypothetical protein